MQAHRTEQKQNINSIVNDFEKGSDEMLECDNLEEIKLCDENVGLVQSSGSEKNDSSCPEMVSTRSPTSLCSRLDALSPKRSADRSPNVSDRTPTQSRYLDYLSQKRIADRRLNLLDNVSPKSLHLDPMQCSRLQNLSPKDLILPNSQSKELTSSPKDIIRSVKPIYLDLKQRSNLYTLTPKSISPAIRTVDLDPPTCSTTPMLLCLDSLRCSPTNRPRSVGLDPPKRRPLPRPRSVCLDSPKRIQFDTLPIHQNEVKLDNPEIQRAQEERDQYKLRMQHFEKEFDRVKNQLSLYEGLNPDELLKYKEEKTSLEANIKILETRLNIINNEKNQLLDSVQKMDRDTRGDLMKKEARILELEGQLQDRDKMIREGELEIVKLRSIIKGLKSELKETSNQVLHLEKKSSPRIDEDNRKLKKNLEVLENMMSQLEEQHSKNHSEKEIQVFEVPGGLTSPHLNRSTLALSTENTPFPPNTLHEIEEIKTHYEKVLDEKESEINFLKMQIKVGVKLQQQYNNSFKETEALKSPEESKRDESMSASGEKKKELEKIIMEKEDIIKRLKNKQLENSLSHDTELANLRTNIETLSRSNEKLVEQKTELEFQQCQSLEDIDEVRLLLQNQEKECKVALDSKNDTILQLNTKLENMIQSVENTNHIVEVLKMTHSTQEKEIKESSNRIDFLETQLIDKESIIAKLKKELDISTNKIKEMESDQHQEPLKQKSSSPKSQGIGIPAIHILDLTGRVEETSDILNNYDREWHKKLENITNQNYLLQYTVYELTGKVKRVREEVIGMRKEKDVEDIKLGQKLIERDQQHAESINLEKIKRLEKETLAMKLGKDGVLLKRTIMHLKDVIWACKSMIGEVARDLERFVKDLEDKSDTTVAKMIRDVIGRLTAGEKMISERVDTRESSLPEEQENKGKTVDQDQEELRQQVSTIKEMMKAELKERWNEKLNILELEEIVVNLESKINAYLFPDSKGEICKREINCCVGTCRENLHKMREGIENSLQNLKSLLMLNL